MLTLSPALSQREREINECGECRLVYGLVDRSRPILVMASSWPELQATKDLLRGWVEPSLIFEATGVGAGRAIQRLEIQLGLHPDIQAVVHLGFAGALTPGLKIGALLDLQLVKRTGLPALNLNLSLNLNLNLSLDKEQGSCGLLSMDETVYTPADKARLLEKLHQERESLQEWAVDMETYAVAMRLAGTDVAYHPLRAISDGAQDALPRGCAEWIDEAGRPEPLKAMRYLLAQPHHLGMLLQLGKRSKLAAKRLAYATQDLLLDQYDDGHHL